MGAAVPTLAPVDPQAVNRIRGHVQFLASDDLEGRDTGSQAYRIAAQYVASQFSAVGLKPGGTNGGWFLEVPFRKATHAQPPTVTLVHGGERVALKIGADVSLRPSMTQKSVSAEAPLVFVGRGINDAALGINDYAGIEARGKIVVVMAGTPSGLRSDVAAHLHSAKEDMAKAAGAVGFIELPVPGVRSSRQNRLTATGPRIDLGQSRIGKQLPRYRSHRFKGKRREAVPRQPPFARPAGWPCQQGRQAPGIRPPHASRRCRLDRVGGFHQPAGYRSPPRLRSQALG